MRRQSGEQVINKKAVFFTSYGVELCDYVGLINSAWYELSSTSHISSPFAHGPVRGGEGKKVE